MTSETQEAQSAKNADVRASDRRYFYVEAHTPRGVVYCGKVHETEAVIRATFTGCTIKPNGVVHVWRGPNDTRASVASIRAFSAREAARATPTK